MYNTMKQEQPKADQAPPVILDLGLLRRALPAVSERLGASQPAWNTGYQPNTNRESRNEQNRTHIL